jgi:hypothetical protein
MPAALTPAFTPNRPGARVQAESNGQTDRKNKNGRGNGHDLVAASVFSYFK